MHWPRRRKGKRRARALHLQANYNSEYMGSAQADDMTHCSEIGLPGATHNCHPLISGSRQHTGRQQLKATLAGHCTFAGFGSNFVWTAIQLDSQSTVDSMCTADSCRGWPNMELDSRQMEPSLMVEISAVVVKCTYPSPLGLVITRKFSF